MNSVLKFQTAVHEIGGFLGTLTLQGAEPQNSKVDFSENKCFLWNCRKFHNNTLL
jgi:hypothetical protein